jgi:type II secretory ATPase GspE/PulE/Tfp pilus assembly ATPase PilB-like protein
MPNSLTPEKSFSTDVNARLHFLENLQALANKIHATNNIDEIMLDLSKDICILFNCDRLTIYTYSEDKSAIISKVKIGLSSFKEIKLAVSEFSIAGYCVMAKKTLNIKDVYDSHELQSYDKNLQFQRGVDERTGYRTKQMLVSPLINPITHETIGAIQLINNLNNEPFNHIVTEGVSKLSETLSIAITQRQKTSVKGHSKYDYLILDAILTKEDLEKSVEIARAKKISLEDVLMKEFHISAHDIGQALSKFYRVPYLPFQEDRERPSELLKNLKRKYIEQNQWIPIEEAKNSINILTTDPHTVINSRIVNNVYPKFSINYYVCGKQEFQKTVQTFFDSSNATGSISDILSEMEQEESDEDNNDFEDDSGAIENELVKLVNKIIIDAYKQGASDIHIEPRPGKDKVIVRFRKDGSLGLYTEVPAHYRNALLARIKIMCDLDISERRKPQDGKIKFKKFGPLDIELRVATIPTAGGLEDVVMRILSAGEPISLEKLNILPHNLTRLIKAIENPYGIFFVCGPTGSGKTTTLHSILHHLNNTETKIWTAEDPVEITQKGLRQVQVNRKAGLDFATVMRSFLRADPDIIMVGEMRDKETVSIGIEASLTGHLVFATLHTNSAPESIVRLLDMGMDPFNFADALLGVLAQRLAKRLCNECKKAYHPSEEEIRALLDEYCTELSNTPQFLEDPVGEKNKILAAWKSAYADPATGQFTLYHPVGCEHCIDGYRGRVGLHELMIGTDGIKKLLQEHARVADILSTALDDGMLTLKMDGIEKILSGLTNIKQVRIVCIK